jgi:hypothetical protein
MDRYSCPLIQSTHFFGIFNPVRIILNSSRKHCYKNIVVIYASNDADKMNALSINPVPAKPVATAGIPAKT